jgi:hypothetical protein
MQAPLFSRFAESSRGVWKAIFQISESIWLLIPPMCVGCCWGEVKSGDFGEPQVLEVRRSLKKKKKIQGHHFVYGMEGNAMLLKPAVTSYSFSNEIN